MTGSTGSGHGRRKYLLAMLVCALLVGAAAGGRVGAPALAATESFPLAGLTAVVTGDVCNLRDGPGTQYRVTGRVARGDRLTVVAARAGWVNVHHGGGQAWIAGWLVEIDLTPRQAVVVVERSAVNLRSGPGLQYRVVGRTERGERHPARLLRGEWVQVVAGGGTAWVWLPLVSLQAGSPGGEPGTAAPVPVAPVREGPLAPSPGFPDGMLVYPLGAGATVRRTTVADSEAVGRITVGNGGRYLGTREGWVRVQMADGTRGWVPGAEVRMEWPHDRRIYCRVGPGCWEMGRYRTATVTARNVNFRSGPGFEYRVLLRLNRGEVLRVLGRSGNWIQALSPRGEVGWVAAWLTGGVRVPGDDFRVAVEGDEKVRVLTVAGRFSSATVVPLDGGKGLVVRTSSPLAGQGAVGVGTYEFDYVSVTGNEVAVFLRERASYRVVESGHGRVVLEFRPVVSAVALEAGEGGEVLTIRTAGYARPQVRRDGGRVEVFLAGATADHALTGPGGAPGGLPADGGVGSGLVAGLEVRPGTAGVTVAAATLPGVTLRVEKDTDVIRVHFRPPGLRGKTVVIDPGHGGEDTGARGPAGLLEKHINWEICWRLAQLLQSRGAMVILTRQGDGPAQPPRGWSEEDDDYEGELAWRAAWSRGADLYVSVHNDYYPGRSAQGTTTYVAPGTLNETESRRLAVLVQEEVVRALGTLSRGVREAQYYVIRKARCPAVLVELMYMSNPREESLLSQEATLWRAAEAIVTALDRYCGAPAGEELPSEPQVPQAPHP